MGQIMRLRRIATRRREYRRRQTTVSATRQALTTLVKDYGLLHEAELVPRSYGGDSWFGKFHPSAGKELLASLPAILKGRCAARSTRRSRSSATRSPRDLRAVQRIFDSRVPPRAL